jgi:large subunit ribosomal protein L28
MFEKSTPYFADLDVEKKFKELSKQGVEKILRQKVPMPIIPQLITERAESLVGPSQSKKHGNKNQLIFTESSVIASSVFEEPALLRKNQKGQSSSSSHSLLSKPLEDDYWVEDSPSLVLKSFSEKKNHIEYAKKHELSASIIKIKVHGFNNFDYNTPYRSASLSSQTGSGFVTAYQGKYIILTNAHVVQNATYIELFSMVNHQKYKAWVEYVSSEADLAIIHPVEESFYKNLKPLKLSDQLHFKIGEDEISVKGYPMGGQELCETFGKITRMEVSAYVNRSQRLMQFQVDAAINHGNSGGPVLKNDEVIGVAFQSNKRGEGLGYVIPTIIIKHFLEDSLAHPLQRGFPELPIEYQSLENKNQRAFLGLKSIENQGVLIKNIPFLFAGRGVLKERDIILSINGKKINSDGTIDYPWREHVDMAHEIKMMHLGDNVAMKILRDGSFLNVSYQLHNRFGDTYHVRPARVNRKPTYLVESGLVFTPVSEDNLQYVSTRIFKKYDIQESRKTHPEEEIIYLSNVLKSAETVGYSTTEGSVLKAINGTTIINMPQLLKILSTIEPGTVFEVTFQDDDILHLKKFDEDQTKKMCRKHDIRALISDDLMPEQIESYFLRDILYNVTHAIDYVRYFDKYGENAPIDFDHEDDIFSDIEKGVTEDAIYQKEVMISPEEDDGVNEEAEFDEDFDEDLDDTDDDEEEADEDDNSDLSFISSDDTEGRKFTGVPSEVLATIGSIAARQRVGFWQNINNRAQAEGLLNNEDDPDDTQAVRRSKRQKK